jgi:hypothetical protein
VMTFSNSLMQRVVLVMQTIILTTLTKIVNIVRYEAVVVLKFVMEIVEL